MKYLSIALLISLFPLSKLQGQEIAVKTNLLYGLGTLTPNAGIEFGLGSRSTLNATIGYNPWNLKGNATNNKKLVHWLGELEYRYWLCEKFNGHFLGVHALGSKYNISQHNILSLFDSQYRYQGYALGGGVSYGYQIMLNKRLNIEFTIGGGAAYFDYGKYECRTCGDKLGDETKVYWGLTNAGISIMYFFK